MKTLKTLFDGTIGFLLGATTVMAVIGSVLTVGVFVAIEDGKVGFDVEEKLKKEREIGALENEVKRLKAMKVK